MTTSQRIIALMSRGDHHAGASHSKPKSSITKKRGPNPKGSLRRGRPRAPVSRGINGCIRSLPGTSFRNFDGGNNLADDLVGSQTFEVGLRLEQYAVSQNGLGRCCNVFGLTVMAAFSSRQ